MIALKQVARIQYLQWGAIAIWTFFLHEDFMKRVFNTEPSTGFKHSIERWGFAVGSFALCLINIAAAQFDVDASIRKFLQYFMGGYFVTIGYYVYNGTAEKFVPIIVWAAINGLLNIIAVYVWHKDAKNDFATPDKKLTLACRITYLTQFLGIVSVATGFHWRYFADQSLGEDPSNVELTHLSALFNVFLFMGAAAVSQVESDDQKKFVQYSMLMYLFGFVKLVHFGLELKDGLYCKGFFITTALLQAQVFLTYGGSCLKTIIRCLYTCCFGMAYMGLFNTSRFLKMTVGDLNLSNEAGLLLSCGLVYIGLVLVAVAQLEADAHRKVLQYYTVGNILLFFVIHQTPSMTDTIPDKWYILGEAVVLVLAIYQKEFGLDQCKLMCPFAWAQYFENFESAPSSPKRSANKGRSATPGGKSTKKKK